jgi:hypothetical protein
LCWNCCLPAHLAFLYRIFLFHPAFATSIVAARVNEQVLVGANSKWVEGDQKNPIEAIRELVELQIAEVANLVGQPIDILYAVRAGRTKASYWFNTARHHKRHRLRA